MDSSQIIKELKKNCKDKERVALYFDIDSTILNVSPRITKIYHEFAKQLLNEKKFTSEAEKLLRTQQDPKDWGIDETLRKNNLDDAPTEFSEELYKFWSFHFHSNNFLAADIPQAGSVELLNELHDYGAQIIYLTGRDVERYQPGTKNVLQDLNYPHEGPKVTFALKPDFSLKDAEYKLEYIRKHSVNFEESWFIDNEPVNTNLVAKELPDVKVVFFDSTHSRKEEPLESLPRLSRFTIEVG